MKITHNFVILGLCLSSIACGGVDKKSEKAAEESCSLLADCGGALVDENECISEQLEEHQEIKNDYGSNCLDKFLDVQNCVNDNFTCSLADDDNDDIEDSPILTKCLDVVLDVLDECGADVMFDIEDDLEDGSDL